LDPVDLAERLRPRATRWAWRRRADRIAVATLWHRAAAANRWSTQSESDRAKMDRTAEPYL